MTTTDLGWIATVTSLCATHGLTETWGVKGDTQADAWDKLADTEMRAKILGAHELAEYRPIASKVYPLPDLEPDPLEEAATALKAIFEDLSISDRLQVLRMAIKAEEWEAHISEDVEVWERAHQDA